MSRHWEIKWTVFSVSAQRRPQTKHIRCLAWGPVLSWTNRARCPSVRQGMTLCHHYTTDTWTSLEEDRYIVEEEGVRAASNENLIWGHWRKRKMLDFRESQPCYFSHKGAQRKSAVVLEGQRKVQSAVRESSVARSGVKTRWLRFTQIVHHMLCLSQMFYELKGAIIKSPSFNTYRKLWI